MKIKSCLFILGLILASIGRCAQPSEKALAVVKRAIKAHGGADAIAKLKTASVKSTMKGTFPKLGPVEMTMEDMFDLPNKFRKSLRAKIAGQDLSITWAIDGNKSWYKENDRPVIDLKVERGADSQYHPLQVFQQLVESVDRAKLRLLQDRQIDGQALVPVELTQDGKLLGTLFFDKKTALLARTGGSKTIPFLAPDKEIEIEVVDKEYKRTAGLNLPMKQLVLHNGHKMLEIDILEVKLLKKLEDKLFEKPAK